MVLEASDGVGGRVRTDEWDGFLLDRGFQVLFTAYPAARRQLDYERLDLRRYEPGALICQGNQRHLLTDPLRDPGSALPAVLSPLVPFADKLRTFRLTEEIKRTSLETIFKGPDSTTETYLREQGFSEAHLDNFLRRFFGGIFLSTTLQTSSQAFRFYWKMLSEGDTVVPARGMGQISWQLAEELIAGGRIFFRNRVAKLHRATSDGRVVGAVTEDGETFEADITVLAVPAPEAARLTELSTPEGNVGTVTLYFAGDAPITPAKKIILHANRHTFLNNVAPVTNIAPEQAPAGKHLLAASTIGVPEGDDHSLFQRAMHDLRRMFAGDKEALAALETYQPLTLYRIPYAQFAQPPGIYSQLPGSTTDIPGLLFASEFTGGSNLNATMVSGENAARIVLQSGVSKTA
ncbi:MAG: NAD(P)/FAD-dependent oxidoreductase [Armatimonadaceae bacterium]